MCVNEGNTTQQEVDALLQFVTLQQKTPLSQLLAAIAIQARTPGGICVAMANAPLQERQMPPLEGGPGPGLYATPPVFQPPEKSIEDDE